MSFNVQNNKNIGLIYILIALLSLLFTVLFLRFSNYNPDGDSVSYLLRATDLSLFLSPEMNSNFSPGYSIFLFIIYPITQNNTYLIAVIQSVVFSLSFWYFISPQLTANNLSIRAFYILCLFSLLCPTVITSNAFILTESITSSLLLIAFGILARLQNKANPIYIVWLSWTLGFLSIHRPEFFIVAFPLILIFAIFYSKIPYYKISLLFIFPIILLTFNSYRNSIIYKNSSPFSFGSGTVMFGGNNMYGDASWHPPSFHEKNLDTQKINKIHSISSIPNTTKYPKIDSLFKSFAIEAWKTDPIFQISLLPIKFGKLWLFPAHIDIYSGETTVIRGLRVNDYFRTVENRPIQVTIKRIVFVLAHWFYLLIITLGISLKIIQKKIVSFDLVLFSFVIGVTCMYSIFFYGLPRFHTPLITLLLPYIPLLYRHQKK